LRASLTACGSGATYFNANTTSASHREAAADGEEENDDDVAEAVPDTDGAGAAFGGDARPVDEPKNGRQQSHSRSKSPLVIIVMLPDSPC
jgi:hypothetical protein